MERRRMIVSSTRTTVSRTRTTQDKGPIAPPKPLCIAVLGATGRTGQQLVKQALERGHTVHALVRNPDKLTEKHDKLKVIKTDIFDENSLVDGMRGCDVVLSALGGGISIFRVTVYSQSMTAIAAAMRTTCVKRFIACTAANPKDQPDGWWIEKHVLVPLLNGQLLADIERMETALKEQHSRLNYTTVRPPQLNSCPMLEAPVSAVTGDWNPEAASSIPRANVARFMLDCISDATWDRNMVAIGMVTS